MLFSVLLFIFRLNKNSKYFLLHLLNKILGIMDLTFVVELLTSLTNKVNAMTTNAKKIDELPVQVTIIPQSKIHVSKNGVSESLTIQRIIDAITNNLYDSVIYLGEISKVSNIITVPLNATWKISNVVYQTVLDTEITVPYCATGLNRIDILVANTSNQIVRISGDETSGIVVRPNIPINTILVTEFGVSDSVIGSLSAPIYDTTASHLKGYYNITTNTPTLANGSGNQGDEYISTIAGSRDFGAGVIAVGANDIIAYNNGFWFLKGNNNPDLSSKLDVSAYNDRFKGKYTSLVNLQSAHPISNDGDYAIIDAGSGSNALEYIWDTNEGWLLAGSAGASTTDALTEGSTNLYFTIARVLAALTDVSFGAFINGLTSKTIPIDTDSLSIVDSADSNKQKKVSLTNLKAFLKTYFDTLYTSKFRISNTASSSAVTGTTTTTIAQSAILVPANTFKTGDVVVYRCRTRRTVSVSSNTVIYLYFSTNPALTSITGAINVGYSIIGGTSTLTQVKSELVIKNQINNTEIVNYTNNDDDIAGQDYKNIPTIDWSIDQYLYIFINNAQTTTSSYLSFWELYKK